MNRQRQSIENTFQSKLIDWFNCNGGYARNIHGNLYQSGIPDVAVTSKNGVTFFIELKVWRNVNPPKSPKDFLRMCRKEQKLFITQTWGLGGYCPIVAIVPSGDKVFATDGERVFANVPQAMMLYLVNLSHGDFTHE